MPRSVATNQEMRERSRERILGAALEVFAEKGYEAASISDVTARAGVSRGLVAYYFPSKRELAAQLLDRWLDGIAGLLAITGTPDERLAGIIDGALTAAAAGLPVQRLAISLMMQPSTHGVFAEVETRKSARLVLVEDAIREVFAARGAADPAVEEMLLRATLEGVTVKLAIYPETFPLEHVRRRLHAGYGLPAPTTPLPVPSPPVNRLRAKA
ncbi:transcriptional regulator, TetR family [Kribbella flavida DSM 17836]|uniref:Transcriptional regulator, TetR family n=1 Tax=Kribbella flavida (strain DSM 17836 / JCM 10339 / NBRC 14399) TaxID=479435 RepID=D2Q1C2_KRIFD|nr:TetR/AcrR family transcriptional regulator [Kribbella flavida]ADB30110.1 transcriptional regulator, TetR family [Kribbella flavida DSM 17836]